MRITYSKSEEVGSIDEIENDIARECLRFLDIKPPIYISTVGDVPASTGLGGSSAFAVGLLHALHTYRGERVSAGQLAEEACHIEIDVLGQPIGKQDQYAAAFGGLNVFRFLPDGGVTVQHIGLNEPLHTELFGSMLMFWSGHQRDASEVLTMQQKNTHAELDRLVMMRSQVSTLQSLVGNGHLDVETFGRILHDGWMLKRELVDGMSNGVIDWMYERAMSAGAIGGKLCGAGGGGLVLFIAPPSTHAAIRDALADFPELEVDHEAHGSRVVVPFRA